MDKILIWVGLVRDKFCETDVIWEKARALKWKDVQNFIKNYLITEQDIVSPIEHWYIGMKGGGLD